MGSRNAPIPDGVESARCLEVDRVVRIVRHRVREVEGDSEVLRTAIAQVPRGQTVREVLVVQRGEGRAGLHASRSMLACRVPDKGGAERLVEGRPVVDPVAEGVVHRIGVVAEAQGGVAVRPSALLLERLGKVPVVQSEPRQDPGAEQLVDEPAVEVEPRSIDRLPVGAHARPAHREPVRVDAEVAS